MVVFPWSTWAIIDRFRTRSILPRASSRDGVPSPEGAGATGGPLPSAAISSQGRGCILARASSTPLPADAAGIDPVSTLTRRGMAKFVQDDVDGSIADFDLVIHHPRGWSRTCGSEDYRCTTPNG